MRRPLTALRLRRSHAASRSRLAVVASPALLAGGLLLAAPMAHAGEPATPSATSPAATTPAATSPTTATGAPTASTPTATTPGETTPAATTPPGASGPAGGEGGGEEPAVQEQHLQHVTRPRHLAGSRRRGGHRHAGAATPGSGAGNAAGEQRLHKGHKAPSPRTLTPALPPGLGSVGGVSGFFVESFQIPPFLLPIYQAAGSAYDIPWEVLAAINEIETDYGRDLSVSSAGAEGWMQFLPSSWAQYGVDANGDGYRDPYNPADAIFAAARYLRAAGGAQNIRAAVFSYNHSQAYVSSVMLRAQLLAGTPPELLDAVTGLTDARFPVYAPSHYADGFPTLTVDGHPQTLAGTTIYSQAGAPVVAVQDGEVLAVGDTPTLGHYVSLRDGYGNVYTYAQLGAVASLYPVLQPRAQAHAGSAGASHAGASLPKPSGPATAGVQPRSPLSPGAIVSGLALGAAAALEASPPAALGAVAGGGHALQTEGPRARAHKGPVKVFASGQDDVYLHALRAGVQVLAGTVLGHVAATSLTGGEPHLLFQIRPAGAGAPQIDPKPILDGWVALQNTSTFRAKGGNPFPLGKASAGQVLLESERQLERQVGGDHAIHMRACERRDAVSGHDDRRVLATLELLSASGQRASVTGLPCGAPAPASEGNARAGAGASVKIVAIDGVPVAGHQGGGSPAAAIVSRLLSLQGVDRPARIVSLVSHPGAKIAVRSERARDYVEVVFGPLRAAAAGAAGGHGAGTPAAAAAAVRAGAGLSGREWVRLIARLGEIPDPTVAGGPSPAALPDAPSEADATGAGEGGAGGHH
ncbi:MAG TPA: lytic murein transglycosylase [Solirubrobacteraceae bacterium]|nr:lytic murein transglycosylase [Solirubrobacteraceae bacterium]